MKKIIIAWPILLLVSFVSIYLNQTPFLGYRWFVELATAFFLLLSLLLALFDRKINFTRFGTTEFVWIFLPIGLFVLWSGFACLWANAWRPAMHHALLWGCYTAFYILIRSAVKEEKSRSRTLHFVGIVVLIISSACLVEFLFSPRAGFVTFVTRYYQNSEILVSLLPLVLVGVASDEVSRARRAMFISIVAWAAVVVVASRTIFSTGVGAIFLVSGASMIVHRQTAAVKRWLMFAGLVIAVTAASQFLLKADLERALFQRFAGTDKVNVQNAGLRLFYWGTAVEGFKSSPAVGIGGDNYFTDYKILRERYATTHPDNTITEITEELIPERDTVRTGPGRRVDLCVAAGRCWIYVRHGGAKTRVAADTGRVGGHRRVFGVFVRKLVLVQAAGERRVLFLFARSRCSGNICN